MNTDLESLYCSMNRTTVDFGRCKLLHELISEQCMRTPDSMAVVWEDREMTYKQLDELSDQIAARLRRQGIANGTLVGVCCSRQLDMPAVLVGILKAGAAYVPLDPDYPLARLTQMSEDSRLQAILAHRAQSAIVGSFQKPVIFVDELDHQPTQYSEALRQALTPSPDSAAYVIYTSGSTGKPKGVVISHRSIVNLLMSMKNKPGFGTTDRILATTTLSFDISIVEMFLPLITGGSIAVVDRETAKDPKKLTTAIERHEVNIVQATPAMWRMIFENNFVGGRHLTFYTGGEPLARDLMLKMLPHCREIWNMYGPTEATVYASIMRLTNADQRILIGWPVANTQLLVVDTENRLCPPETPGELLIGGVQLATEYLNRPELTAEKFVMLHGTRYYRTGDLAQVTAQGLIDHLGRIDAQIKLNGHRIELGEIEAAIAAQPGIRQAAVTLREDMPGNQRLVGYVLLQDSQQFDWSKIRQSLTASLPDYMVPAIVVAVDQFHFTPSGKLDRKAFPAPVFDRNAISSDYIPPRTEDERAIVALWQSVLGIEPVGVQDNFFELGGNSLLAAKFLQKLRESFKLQLSSARFFNDPTIRGSIAQTTRTSDADPIANISNESSYSNLNLKQEARSFAVVGMSARFPGARGLQQFWQNLLEGRESIRFFKPEELDPSIDPNITNDPRYVAARGIIEEADHFDASFFAEPPKSAALIDPQQRVMLEVAYEALEDAGIRTDRPSGRIGVWAGTYSTTYHVKNVLASSQVVAENGEFQLGVYNEKDYLASRIAYKLNLNGPAVNVNTACSTSLVAVIEACNSLSSGHCDAAIAGACSIYFPQHSGHIHQPGSIFSPDGHCRPFDADGAGTLFSDGAGAIVLKRLEDAIRDGDRIYATICGRGINNDGSVKASFSAPTISGEADAVQMALDEANFSPRSISYIEAHGTATPVGDPIEIAALQSVFEPTTSDRQFCAIGSVKSNIGHTVAAAGMAGLIKTALSLHHQIIPPTLHYQRPFAEIDFQASPFYVCNTKQEWKRDLSGLQPRRAGVSSFGVGGTNAHVVLQEAPATCCDTAETHCTSNRYQAPTLWPVSAKTDQALDQQLKQLADHCLNTTDSIENIAFTLQTCRNEMASRAVVMGTTLEGMREALAANSSGSVIRRRSSNEKPPVVFMFPGQGAQYWNMSRSLYEGSPVYKTHFDRCCDILAQLLSCDLRDILFGETLDPQERELSLRNTRLTQPALFCVGYSLGKTLQEWGIQPNAMIGHSIGEFAAACLAGVFSLEDGLKLISQRGALMQSLPSGAMMSVRLAGSEVETMLRGQLAIAAYNGPNLCVVAGPCNEVSELQSELELRGVVCRPLQTSHAFHSPMMDSIVAPFTELVQSVQLSKPNIPIVSTVTGNWLTADEATNPQYWANHLRLPVRFASAVSKLWGDSPESVLVELGPRRTLATLAKQQANDTKLQVAIPTLGDGEDITNERRSILSAIAHLWCCGVEIPWRKICLLCDKEQKTPPLKVSLPTYPFQRKRHFIDAPNWPCSPRENQPSVNELSQSSVQATQAKPLVENKNSQQTQVKRSTTMTRKPQINIAVREVLENTSGFEMSQHGDTTAFFEIGFDSLLMTQTAKALSTRFRVDVSFRHLLEKTPDLGSLTDWLDQILPADGEFNPNCSQPNEPCAPPVSANQNSEPTNSTVVTQPAQAIAPVVCNINTVPQNSVSQPTTVMATPVLLSDLSNPNLVAQVPNNSVRALMMGQLQLLQSVMHSQLQILAGGVPVGNPAPAISVSQPALSQPNPPSNNSASLGTSANLQQTSIPAVAQPASWVVPTADKNNSTNVSADSTQPAPKAFGAAARVVLSENDLSAEQAESIQQFSQKYVANRTESKRQAQQHRRYMADARTVSGFRPSLKEMTFPIVVERSKGVHLWDVDGNRYVDLTCGFGSNFLGHGPDFMIEAMTRQLQTDYSIGPQTPLAGEVARLFSEITGSERVAFSNTGSEAVLGATRLARTFTGKDKIVMFHGDYHGILDEVIVRGNNKLKSFPAATGIPPQHVSNTVLLEYGDPASLEFIKSNLHELAAVVVEPVQSRRPELQPREFLQQLAGITESVDTALIFDEVISGLRIAPGGAQQYFGVKADIATYGKVVGGGMPIGVIAGKAKYMDGFDGGFWKFGDDSRPEAGMTYFAGTFVRHPVTMAAAKRILEYIQAEGQPMYDRINSLSNYMAKRLNELFATLDAPLFLANFGSLFKVQFKYESHFSELVFAHLRRKGFFIWDHRPCLLTIQHNQEHIDGFIKAFEETIVELQRQRFLSGEGFKKVARQQNEPNSMDNPQPRQGKDKQGIPAFFVPDSMNPGRYIEVGAK